MSVWVSGCVCVCDRERACAPVTKRREGRAALQKRVVHSIVRKPQLEGEHARKIARERDSRLRAYESVRERETEREILFVREEVSGRGRKREGERAHLSPRDAKGAPHSKSALYTRSSGSQSLKASTFARSREIRNRARSCVVDYG